MRRMWLMLMPLLAVVVHADDGPFPKTDSVEQKLKALDRSAVAIEYQAISTAVGEIEQKKDAQVRGLYEKMEKIRQTDAYRKYAQDRRALEAQRSAVWEVERKAIADAARAIYAARHGEIRSVAKPDLPEARKLGFDVLTYPRVDGSTSSEPLSVVVASRVLGVPYAWIYPEPTGRAWRNQPDVSEYFLPGSSRGYDPRNYDFQLATLRVVAKPEQKAQQRLAVMINSLLAASTSTHDAYVNLIEGKSDLNLAARPPSESERKLAVEKGVVIKLEPVARDAFVIVVNRKNPVKGLTRQQVREIYEERITEWKAVGGGDGKITAFRRERDSGSRELFDALVMQGQALSEDRRFRDLYANSMGGPFSQVTQMADGLGYSIYYYEHFMAASPFTRTLAIDGVEPTAETIASGEYPWVTRVYVAYREGEAQDSPGMKLMRWLLSAEGQSVVRESGYVAAQ